MNTTKRVEYAYPTSSNARRFGYASGCWCVELVDYTPSMQPPRAVAAFATLELASAAAEAMPQPWDRFSK